MSQKQSQRPGIFKPPPKIQNTWKELNATSSQPKPAIANILFTLEGGIAPVHYKVGNGSFDIGTTLPQPLVAPSFNLSNSMSSTTSSSNYLEQQQSISSKPNPQNYLRKKQVTVSYFDVNRGRPNLLPLQIESEDSKQKKATNLEASTATDTSSTAVLQTSDEIPPDDSFAEFESPRLMVTKSASGISQFTIFTN